MNIPYPAARILGGLAVAEATARGVPMATAIVDAAGQLQFFGRMDDALPASAELAVNKAYTAALLRRPTHEIGRLAQPGQVLYGLQNTHGGRIVLLGGGFPLHYRGRTVGGIGLSGGTPDEDVGVAQTAVGAFELMGEWSALFEGPWPRGRNQNMGLETLAAELASILAYVGGRSAGPILTGAALLAASRPD
ncbi:MAG: heme-binding protein [Pseudomonadota bacterium]